MRLFQNISGRAVAGFACQQGFLYALFYTGSNRSVAIGGLEFERVDLLFTFVFMAAAFLAVCAASRRARNALLAPTLVGWYAVLVVIGSLLVVLPIDAGLPAVAAEGALVGIPAGFLMCAWGRALLECPRFGGAREVLLATALGAAFSLAVSLVPIAGALDVLKLLPIGSVWALRSLADARTAPAPNTDAGGAAEDAAASDEAGIPLSLKSLIASSQERGAAARLSAKVIAGTALFGLAGGCMEVFSSEPGMASFPTFPATLLILVLFCVAAGQLHVGLGAQADREEGSLAEVYRMAILLIVAGYLFVPVLSGFGVTGQTIVLAGYLGLTCVLMTMFLTIARAAAQDAAVTFAHGFCALFLGEAAGIAFGNVIELVQPGVAQPLAVTACAGLASLFAYLFLFTERDFGELASLASTLDAFDQVCQCMIERFGLSKREAEVLPLALRGRTSERIASELFIAKSTADTHLRRIYAKTDVHGRQELIDLSERLQTETTRRS